MAPKKSIFITGCSKGGIGDGLAREFHNRGLTVFAATRNQAKMVHLKELGINTIEMDVTNTESITKAVAEVRQATAGRGLDILINCAGIYQLMPFLDTPMDDIRRTFETNVFGLLAVTQAFLPLIIEAKGMVANIGSVNEVVNPVFSIGYNASKMAVNAISATLRQELRPFGVKVVHIKTGSVKSGMTRGEGPVDKLPPDSLYAPSKAAIEDRGIVMRWYDKFQTPEQFAKKVAKDLLGNPGPVIWRGALVTYMRICNFLLFMRPNLFVSTSCPLPKSLAFTSLQAVKCLTVPPQQDGVFGKASGLVGVKTDKVKST